VPNAALRFTPAVSEAAPVPAAPGGILGKLLPRPPSQPPKPAANSGGGAPRVWVLREGQPVAIDIQPGATNGQLTEVSRGALSAGTQVITEALGLQP